MARESYRKVAQLFQDIGQFAGQAGRTFSCEVVRANSALVLQNIVNFENGATKSNPENAIKLFETLMLSLSQPDMIQRASKALQQTEQGHQENGFGIVIVGSNASGGRFVRRAAGTETKDLDTILLSPRPLPHNDTIARDLTVALSTELGSSATICETHNPLTMQVVNLTNGQAKAELDKDFQETDGSILMQKAEAWINFFRPSIPPQLNSQNIRIFLGELASLAVANQAQYQKVRGALLSAWKKEVKPIKLQYFNVTKKDIPDDAVITWNNIEEDTEVVVGEILETLLNVTT